MQFRIEPLPNGDTTVKDLQSGESMHSTIGPWVEANSLYIEQSQLEERLNFFDSGPLVIYDVGLGIAANALATLEAFERKRHRRAIHLISFENQIGGLEFALKNSDVLPFLRGRERILETLLKDHAFVHEDFRWELKVGDFRDQVLEAAPPELIFYDFYSPKALPHLWGLHCFQLLFKATESRRSQGLESLLFTYSSSTAVRSALLLAGFHVGYGIATGKKRETTVASTRFKDLKNPLGPEWLLRWSRSDRALPDECSHWDKAEVLRLLKRQVLV